MKIAGCEWGGRCAACEKCRALGCCLNRIISTFSRLIQAIRFVNFKAEVIEMELDVFMSVDESLY